MGESSPSSHTVKVRNLSFDRRSLGDPYRQIRRPHRHAAPRLCSRCRSNVYAGNLRCLFRPRPSRYPARPLAPPRPSRSHENVSNEPTNSSSTTLFRFTRSFPFRRPIGCRRCRRGGKTGKVLASAAFWPRQVRKWARLRPASHRTGRFSGQIAPASSASAQRLGTAAPVASGALGGGGRRRCLVRRFKDVGDYISLIRPSRINCETPHRGVGPITSSR